MRDDMVKSGQKIENLGASGGFVMVTAYDYAMARFLTAAGIDVILVGDSIGTMVLGYADVKAVTLDEMLSATAAVRRGAPDALVVADIPATLAAGPPAALAAGAKRLLKEGGADAVKYEATLDEADTIKLMVEAGVPVMGHIGVLPQSVKVAADYRVRGKSAAEAEYEQLKQTAAAIEQAGAFALLLELVADELAREITAAVKIPTIGIGSRDYTTTTAQVQVFHDVVGLTPPGGFVPRHAAQMGAAGAEVVSALKKFKASVPK